MKKHTFPLEDTGLFSETFLHYVCRRPETAEFYDLFPSPDNFARQVERKKAQFSAQKRDTLHRALNRQYDGLSGKPQIAIDLLRKDNTFTLTTGHQINIFTGPLYFHYKILTVIRAAEELRQKFPEYNFVPVYWAATEDHDAEEISVFRLFGKKYHWNFRPQTGAVGRFDPKSLLPLIEQLPECAAVFAEAYGKYDNLSDATRFIVNELYGKEGLVMVDADDRELKQLFLPEIKKELSEMPAHAAVRETSARLSAKGYTAQVYPREINLFYLKDNLRERLVREGDTYKVLKTDWAFSEAEILAEAEQFPDRFSPNVVLRPLYQEVILPNISYTGGPAEMVYWLQLKSVFEAFGQIFPILLPRTFTAIGRTSELEKFEKLGFETKDIFLKINDLKDKFIQQSETEPTDFSEENRQLLQDFEAVILKAAAADPVLEAYAAARKKELEKSLGQIAKKVKKSEERQFADDFRKIEKIRESLFPNGAPQERTDNFMNFYLNDSDFLQKLLPQIQAFDFEYALFEV